MNTFAYRLMYGLLWQNAQRNMPKLQASIDCLWQKMSDRERAMVGIGNQNN